MSIPTRRIRIAVQFAVFSLWVALILATKHPVDAWIAKHLPVSLFLRIDPLVTTVVSGGMRLMVTITMLGLVTLGVTVLLGRVFCGWVCPLGAIFDFYGWFLRRWGVKFEGPSPSWFRFKYYLLASLLIFAATGAVSPLMGLDPIVLLTRTAAVVVGPFGRHPSELSWVVGQNPGAFGYFVDGTTLFLFLGILASTTKLSRIWCRTACPLGAYLAVASRHSMLRRDTEGCIHCNLCSAHCPTGAISFENAEIYNESECIKCFACSQECPVDANFFTIKSPIPAVTYSQKPVSLERRELLATSAFTILAAPLLHASGGEPQANKRLLRPPMSREEHDFLASCIRCAECMKTCPTGVLKPAGLRFGLRAMWTPHMDTSQAHCQKGCNACSVACPTDAIMKYPLEKKYSHKAGTAVFESGRCISYTENKFCSECVRVCPTNAIEMTRGWEPAEGVMKGRGSDQSLPPTVKPTRPSKVSFDKCVGCGACEMVCHEIVMGEAAMLTTSHGRAVPTRL